MKMKKWHLYIVAILCFILAFVAINRKYDRFYRVNGINNDNRALIEQYLDENEQQYLIENAIPVSKFIDYIQIEDFYLPYYEYYNLLLKAKVYTGINDIVSNGNVLATKLQTQFGQNALSNCRELISHNLVPAFLYEEAFVFENISYYQLIRKLYDNNDFTFVADTNSYIEVLSTNEPIEDMYQIVKSITSSYDKNSLKTLFTTPLGENVRRIYTPEELGLVINQNTFIGTYEPKKLVFTQVPRSSYSMYLEEHTYEALLSLFQSAEGFDEGLILTRGYRSYDGLALQEETAFEKPGYNEYQLGTTIKIQALEYSAEDFIFTQTYQWLITNCHTYGFIQRYPQGKEEVTNHEFSPTTYRYVGVELATTLYDQNLTLEEYQAQVSQ